MLCLFAFLAGIKTATLLKTAIIASHIKMPVNETEKFNVVSKKISKNLLPK